MKKRTGNATSCVEGGRPKRTSPRARASESFNDSSKSQVRQQQRRNPAIVILVNFEGPEAIRKNPVFPTRYFINSQRRSATNEREKHVKRLSEIRSMAWNQHSYQDRWAPEEPNPATAGHFARSARSQLAQKAERVGCDSSSS